MFATSRFVSRLLSSSRRRKFSHATIVETNGHANTQTLFRASVAQPNDDAIELSTSSTHANSTTTTNRATESSLVGAHLLAEDHRHSVGRNFLPYCRWLMVQNTVGSAAYVLSTNAMLVSIGVTNSAASLPLAATINWVLKDGLGSLGMIAYAAYVGQRFDANAKATKWRADALFNVGVLLELATPLAPALFLPLASLANVAKGVGGLAAGASKAALHRTLALRENLGDITAKLYSQGITAYLLGMGLGIQLTMFATTTTTSSLINVWTMFGALTVVHLYASHRALRLLALSSLNHQRLTLLVREFVATSRVVRVCDVAARESIVSPRTQILKARLAPSLSEHETFLRDSSQWKKLIESLATRRYALLPANSIVYAHDATTLDVARSFCEFELRASPASRDDAVVDEQLAKFECLLQKSDWDLKTRLITFDKTLSIETMLNRDR